jgi:hypothetical protein
MISFAKRVQLSISAFFSILGSGELPDDVKAALVQAPDAAPVPRAEPKPAPAAPPPDPGHRATQLLAILQRDGRLVDFLMEDLTPYSDAQVGAAVRDVHAGTRQALTRYFTLEPVIDDEEGRPVTLASPDAARHKIVGNVPAAGPLRGVLRHRGWTATSLALPPLPATGLDVIAPAEIEIG